LSIERRSEVSDSFVIRPQYFARDVGPFQSKEAALEALQRWGWGGSLFVASQRDSEPMHPDRFVARIKSHPILAQIAGYDDD
jgi:hypothetical protein